MVIELCVLYVGVNSQDTFGKTALHYAIETEASQIANFLIENKCDVNIGDNNGITALHTAIKVGNLMIVQVNIELCR